MIRVTTSGIIRNYKSSLMRASNNSNAARNKVLTQRNFISYAEDPAAATQSFKLRRAFSRTNDQLTNTNSLVNKFQSAWDAVNTVKSDLTEKLGKVTANEGNTDTAGAGRQPLGQVLANAAKSIVQTMNCQYGDEFIFSGSDGHTVPFTWGENGELLYRGISVDSGSFTDLPKGTPPVPKDVTATSEWGQYYANNPDFAKLVSMSYESSYLDVGAGLTEDQNGDLISSSAFDSALSGIDILGFGFDEDGDPKNAASLMMKLSDIYSRCDPDSGEYETAADKEVANRLTGKINDALSALTTKWTELDGEAKYLATNKERLKDSASNLNEQILSIEQCNLADAITDFSWAQYCYNAALKVGNDILSQSLIDYMN